MTKKLFSLLSALLLAVAGYAQSGTTGDLTWELNLTDSTLTVSGNGAMPDYYYNDRPWGSYLSSIKSVVIGSGITNISLFAFGQCSGLKSVTISEGVSSIGFYAFYECNGLTSVIIPEGVSTIGNGAFSSCSNLTSVTIPEGVTTIGYAAFAACSSLTSVTIPSSVSTIDSAVFNGCSGLTEVVALNPQPVDIGIYVFGKVNLNTCVLKVPAGSVNLYKAAEVWKNFTNIVGITTTYTATFNSQEGSSVAPQTVEHGSKVTEPAAPTKSGYTFGGWYREAACTNAWDFATDMVTNDTTLYAKWTANPTAVSAAQLLPLTLYPTVTNGELIVENEQWVAGEAIEIYSMGSGALVAKVPTSGEQTTINLSQLPSGTYVVRVGKYAGKVVKQ